MVERPFPTTEEGIKWKKLLSKKKVVLYVGNFARYQGFDQVLRGIRYAFNRGLKETVLLVIGGDYKQVKKKALRLGLIENVIFLGRKTAEESVDLMRLADVCLSMNCVGGNAPSKIIHYFLAGAPILACNAPANRQLLKNEDDAAFCLNDPEHFATVLMDLLDDETALKKLARRSRKNAQQFTFETYRDKLNKCINQAMNQ